MEVHFKTLRGSVGIYFDRFIILVMLNGLLICFWGMSCKFMKFFIPMFCLVKQKKTKKDKKITNKREKKSKKKKKNKNKSLCSSFSSLISGSISILGLELFCFFGKVFACSIVFMAYSSTFPKYLSSSFPLTFKPTLQPLKVLLIILCTMHLVVENLRTLASIW